MNLKPLEERMLKAKYLSKKRVGNKWKYVYARAKGKTAGAEKKPKVNRGEKIFHQNEEKNIIDKTKHLKTAYGLGEKAANRRLDRGDSIDFPSHDDDFEYFIRGVRKNFGAKLKKEEWFKVFDSLTESWEKGRKEGEIKQNETNETKKKTEKNSKDLEEKNLTKKRNEIEKELDTYFIMERNKGNVISLATRENGDVGSETAGKKDIVEANNIKSKLKKKFGDKISIKTEVVDEWVNVDIEIK